jgi:hypothetical protein
VASPEAKVASPDPTGALTGLETGSCLQAVGETSFAGARALDLYCGETDQLISSPAFTGNGSLTVDSPEPRTGVAWKRTHAAPAVTPTGRAKLEVCPEATRPSGVERGPAWTGRGAPTPRRRAPPGSARRALARRRQTGGGRRWKNH